MSAARSVILPGALGEDSQPASISSLSPGGQPATIPPRMYRPANSGRPDSSHAAEGKAHAQQYESVCLEIYSELEPCEPRHRAAADDVLPHLAFIVDDLHGAAGLRAAIRAAHRAPSGNHAPIRREAGSQGATGVADRLAWTSPRRAARVLQESDRESRGQFPWRAAQYQPFLRKWSNQRHH